VCGWFSGDDELALIAHREQLQQLLLLMRLLHHVDDNIDTVV